MNREIKFRGKRIDNNEWCYGFLSKMNDGLIISTVIVDFENSTFYRVTPESISEFTSLKDCKGVEIYEGDIIDTGSGSITQVGFNNGGFYYIGYYSITDIGKNDLVYFGGHSWLTEILTRFKVIGNIYDNINLLSVGK